MILGNKEKSFRCLVKLLSSGYIIHLLNKKNKFRMVLEGGPAVKKKVCFTGISEPLAMLFVPSRLLS